MHPRRHALLSLVERLFSDGVLTPEERTELVSFYRGGGLTVGEVREVFGTFVKNTWGEAIADGVLTDQERKKLETIVRELGVPRDCLPEAFAWLIRAA